MAEKDATARLRRAVKGSYSLYSPSQHLTSPQRTTSFLSRGSYKGRTCEIQTPVQSGTRLSRGLLPLATKKHSSFFSPLATMTKNFPESVYYIVHPLTPGLPLDNQDAENNTILMFLADFKPPPPNAYAPGPSQVDQMGAALRMARLYYDRYTWILDWSNSQGRTALHMAALRGNEELVRVRAF